MQKPGLFQRALMLELLFRLVDLLGLSIAMFLSQLLLNNILFGGAAYITGEVWVLYARMFSKKNLGRLPSAIRVRGLFIFVLAALLTAALVLLFPYIQSSLTSLVLTVLIAGFLAQQIASDFVARRLSPSRPRRRGLLLALCHILFLLAYPLFFFFNQRVLGYPVPADIFTAYTAAVGVSLMLYIGQLREPPAAQEDSTAQKDATMPGAAEPPGDALLKIRAYRIYNRMTVNTLVAVNLSITAFICYMRFLPFTGFWNSLVMLCVWLAFIALVTWLGFALLNRRVLPRFDRYAVFFMGLIFWGVGALGMPSAGWSGSLLSSVLSAAFMGLSLACMFSIILVQSFQMQTVIELGIGEVDRQAYERNTSCMVDWSMMTSYLLLLVMLCIATFITDGKFDQVETIEGMQSLLRVVMLVLPMLYVLVAMVYSLRQPLDKNYAEKLEKLSHQKAEGQENAPLENRLKRVLVEDYPRKLAVILLKPLLRLFFPCKVEGRELVRTGEGPAVFICNHLEVYGPIVAVLYSPFPIRPWIIHGMLDRDSIIEQTRSGAAKLAPFLPERWRTGIVKAITPLVLWILRSTDPIAVYRDSLRGVIQTIHSSVEAMEYDDNILIFPEAEYKADGVGTLFSGFVQLGKSYYQRTGRRTTFYPVYINRKTRRMNFGAGIAFDPANESGEERDRLVEYLHGAMQDMAQDAAPASRGKGRRSERDKGRTMEQ